MIDVVVVYDRDTRTMLDQHVFEDTPADAFTMRLQREIEFRAQASVEVVLVRAKSLADLRSSHARYFAPKTISPHRFDKDIAEVRRKQRERSTAE